MNAKQLIEKFKMQPNDAEGGYYAATYTSSVLLNGKQPICSAIYYMIDPESFSAMHRVKSDMLYHFYDGDPAQVLLLYPPGAPKKSEVCIFSNDLTSGDGPMKVIPGGTWMGSRLHGGRNFAFMGVSLDPGFDPAQYEIGKRDELIREYPEQKELIVALTRE